MSTLATIEALAQQLLSGEITLAQLPQAVADAECAEIPAPLWAEMAAALDHAPRYAGALARVAHAIADAQGDPRPRADASLWLLRALNTLGEFRAALARAQETARRFGAVSDAAGAARAWLEAAWAESYLGNLESARADLDRALHIAPPDDAQVQARVTWIEGRMLREQGEYAEAAQRFERARDFYRARGAPLDAARCERELGHTYSRVAPAQALPLLAQAREIFAQAHCPTEVARCDHFWGQACYFSHQPQPALDAFAQARTVFVEQGLEFFVASCDGSTGLIHWRRNEFEAARLCFERARDCFVRCGAQSEIAICDINIAGVLLELNRYEEGLVRLEHSLQHALATGRRKMAAVCFESMAWAYDKQGRYAQALTYYQQARAEFEKEQARERLVMCDMYLGQTHFNLGEYQEALTVLTRARDAARAEQFTTYEAECELSRARVSLALGNLAEAHAALEHARALFATSRQEVYVAFCDRLLASVGGEERTQALARLESSRTIFVKHGQLVDIALCDLTRGELHLDWKEWTDARVHLEQARRVLHPAFPDQVWRAEYGLGRIAQAQRKRPGALEHYLKATRTIANLRAGLGLEQLSNDLFGARQHVFADALALALALRAEAHALDIVESAKAQTFLSYLTNREWHGRAEVEQDAVGDDLQRRERELRYQLAALRRRLSLQAAQGAGELRDAGQLQTIGEGELRELDALTEAYEAVVARLRLTRQGLAGAPALPPFSLEAFRAMAHARWGERWAALDYYLAGDQLTRVYLAPHALEAETVTLNDYDQAVLHRCTATQPDLRERVYRGTVRGMHVPTLTGSLTLAGSSTSAAQYLRHLAAILLPTQLRNVDRGLVLIISPHGVLHQLPFHALMERDSYVVERFTCLYTPSLQALTALCCNAVEERDPARVLVCGVADFAGKARPLEHTAHEVEAWRAGWGERCTVLWQAAATRRTLLEWSARGELSACDVLHFATHAVVEPRAPHWSRILLTDEDLTVVDILELRLNARLVTLSACASGLAAGGRGDELLGLARAFFYAGARALATSLWAVEDESTAQLMARFCHHLQAGISIGGALRAAQVEMLRAGATPFEWAPFVVMGNA